MSNDTETLNHCEACGLDVEETLTHKRWTHHDPYERHGWAYEDGERVDGDYCHECLRDIALVQADYQDFLNESEEMDVDDWRNLAVKLAYGYSNVATNWEDRLNAREKYELRQEMAHR